MKIKFWGVRGSVPSPLTPTQVTAKVREAIELSKKGLPIPFETESTYGGNTTCVEVKCDAVTHYDSYGEHVCDEELFILDMGTGVRELGKVQLKEIFRTKSLHGTILQSHVHWDHIQGFPFWGPLYLPRKDFNCAFDFYGGKQWDSQLDLVYRSQMDAPNFPVNLQELEQTGMKMFFKTIYDGWTNRSVKNISIPRELRPQVLAKKLFHPQETFGYRIEHLGKSIAFTTDHEPHYGNVVPKGLAELVQGVDIWITDCQYSHDDYIGKTGPQKMNWGHSTPEYIALVAKECGPKKVITTHHDPDASDLKIKDLSIQVQDGSKIETLAAYEGLEIII